MALMSKSVFEDFADRIAKQYSYIKTCFDSLSNSGAGTPYYQLITETELPDVELSMLQAGYNADQWFNQANTVRIVAAYSNFTGLIPSFDYALAKDNTLSDLSWDGYLANVGTKVSDYTNQVYYASKNSYLLAKNVWCEYEKTMASAEMTGASALTYTEGDALYVGDYSAAQKADGTHFAGVAIKAVVTGTNTITSLVVTVTGVNELGVADTVEHITVSGAPGTLSSATTAKFLAITDVSRDSGGSMGDTFAIVNTKDRIISL